MSHSSADEFLRSRRRQDLKIQEVAAFRQAQVKLLQKAGWENLGEQTSNARLRKTLLDKNEDQFQVDLVARKRKLADLLNGEMEMWKVELISKVETPEERQQSVIVRALALRDERERSRKKFVEECYERRWRDSCDDARTLDSKAFTGHVNSQMKNDMSLKHDKHKAEHEADLSLEAMEIADSCKRMEELEQGRKDKTYGLQSSIVGSLDEQVRAKEVRLKAHLNQKQIEEEEELRDVQNILRVEKQEELDRLVVARDRMGEISRENRAIRIEKRIKSQIQAQEDKRLLDYVMDRDRQEDAAKMSNKQEKCDEIKAFEAFVIREKEARDANLAHQDQLIAIENNRIWDKHDAMMRKRFESRNKLLSVVNAGLNVQVADKINITRKEREDNDAICSAIVQRAGDDVAASEGIIERRRDASKQEAQLLQLQIHDNQKKREDMKQLHFLEEKRMTKLEDEHMQRLKSQAGNIRTHFPISKTQLW